MIRFFYILAIVILFFVVLSASGIPISEMGIGFLFVYVVIDPGFTYILKKITRSLNMVLDWSVHLLIAHLIGTTALVTASSYSTQSTYGSHVKPTGVVDFMIVGVLDLLSVGLLAGAIAIVKGGDLLIRARAKRTSWR